MDSYRFSDIDDRADCREIYEALVGPLSRDGRGAATWRGGTNPASVSFTDDGKKYHDHGSEEGGGTMKLVQAIRGCNMLEAAAWIGEYYNLDPVNYAPRSPVQALLDEGYTETCRYDYQDAGALVLQVVRFTHPDKGKTFRQYDPVAKRWRGHKNPPLYNEAGLAGQNWACIVEGEKDADTLIARGWPAVTAAGGSKKWLERHSQALAGLNVVIIADNDEAGQAHALLVARSVRIYAQTIRIVTISAQAKGDVTDYFEAGGTAETLAEVIKASPELGEKDLSDDAAAKAAAKLANQAPFLNYYMADGVNSAGKPCKVAKPRHITEMVNDLFERFVGAPFSCGELLFDRDHDTGVITNLRTPGKLVKWMDEKSGHPSGWRPGEAMTSKTEFFEHIQEKAQKFEAISTIPNLPPRDDVFYALPDLPPPSPGHQYLEKAVDFWKPSSPADRVMAMSFLAAPLLFLPGRTPLWIVDSERRGSGKTTLVSIVAEMYGAPPLQLYRRQLQNEYQEVVNRLISPAGRRSRVVLIDNVAGPTRPISEALSGLVTAWFITGRPKFCPGEQARPNDLTYVITSNNASLDDDLTVRSFFIHLDTIAYSQSAEARMRAFFTKHRLQILADIIDRLEKHTPFDIEKAYTRFPDFEARVIQAMAGDIDTFGTVIEHLAAKREAANIDEERGKQVEDTIRTKLREMGITDLHKMICFIRSQVLDLWLADALPDERYRQAAARELAKSGHCPAFHPKLTQWPQKRDEKRYGHDRRRGMLWIPEGYDSTEKAPVVPHRVIILDNKRVKARGVNTSSFGEGEGAESWA